MIKTIISKDTEELDKAVNDFMAERCQNLPVRTEVYSFNNSIYHKATIFFDYSFRKGSQESIPEEDCNIEISDSETSSKKEKNGALWIQASGIISGNFKGQKIFIPSTLKDKLLNLEIGKSIELKIKEDTIKVFLNKYKKTDKHPDFVIY